MPIEVTQGVKGGWGKRISSPDRRGGLTVADGPGRVAVVPVT